MESKLRGCATASKRVSLAEIITPTHGPEKYIAIVPVCVREV